MATPTPEPGIFTKRIADLLRARMERFKINQGDVSPYVGVSQSQLSKMLNGKRTINLDQLDIMCQMLDLEATELVREVESWKRDRIFGDEPPYLVIDDERVSASVDTDLPALPREQEQGDRKSDVALAAKEGKRK
jgi:DNA-binding Xre family transcriptional regulator